MEKKGVGVPIFLDVQEGGFKGSVDDLFSYVTKKSKETSEKLEANIIKQGKKNVEKYAQFFIPMADGTNTSVLAKLTQGGKISKAKGSIQVTGGLYGPQLERFKNLTSLQDYNETIKKSRVESVYFQKIDELSSRFESIKKAPSIDALEKLKVDILDQKKIADEQGYLTTSLDPLSESVDTYTEKFSKIDDELNDIIYKSASFYTKQKMDIDRITKSLEEAKQQFREYKAEGKDTKAVEKNIKKLSKDLEKVGKQPPLTGIKKFFNTIKRVGFYRVARNLFRFIEQGFGQGLDQLVAFDNEANKTVSSLKSSYEQVGASVAILMMPLIEIIEPVISSISSGIVNFANNISMASAHMKGLGEYTKVSEEYMKDLQQEANSTALSFDKFESLNAKMSPFEKAKINPEDQEKALQYGDTIKRIQGIFEKLWGFIKGVGKIILELFEELEPYLDDILDFGLLLIDGIAKLIAGFGKIFAWLGKIIDTKGDLMALLAIVTSIAATIAFLTGHYVKGTMITLGGLTAMGTIYASQFAEGGKPTQGTLFYAGEAGAELVTTMPSGQTGVTNIAQFRQATVEALYEWWSDAKYDIPEGSTTYLDGAQIARSKSFKNELNRTNSGLNLR